MGLEDHGLYRLVDTSDSQEHPMAAKSTSINNFWHQRYGYLNVHYLSQLVREGLVVGLPKIQTRNCGACQVGKQHRTPFSNGESWRASKGLQLVHANVYGLMNTPSITGSMYFLLFVDDFSRRMWVYFLKNKSEVFSMFQKFKASIEKESGCQIVTLRSKNGREFCSFDFSNYCATHGIKCQLTTPYTPQQNGVVEWQNHTITEMAWSMLEHRHVPKKFWAKAVYTAVYLLNRSPTQAIKKMTPEEAWFGHDPKISHLKVFGSTAHVWILDAKHTKLDSKGQKLMFTDYSDNHNAYRLINVDTDRFIFNRDVVVDEESGPFYLFSPTLSPKDQPLKAKDLGVRLPLAPLDGRESNDSDSEVVESPEHDIAPPNFPPENLDQHPDEFIPSTPSDVDPPELDVGTSTL